MVRVQLNQKTKNKEIRNMKAKEKDRLLQAAISRHCDTWITLDDARILRRAEKTLHRWGEMKCNAEVYEENGATWRRLPGFRVGGRWVEPKAEKIPNREKGTLQRVADVCQHYGLFFYHQTDPRGCALYVSKEKMDCATYYRGIACCD